MTEDILILNESDRINTTVILSKEVKDIDEITQVTYHLIKQVLPSALLFKITYKTSLFDKDILLIEDSISGSCDFVSYSNTLLSQINNFNSLFKHNQLQPILQIILSR